MKYEIFSLTLRYFFLFTPFSALMMFLYLTRNHQEGRRRREAIKIAVTSLLFSLAILFIGESIFKVLGITLNAFRVGVGIILLLDGITLVKGKVDTSQPSNKVSEIVFVPMTIPVIIGPAVIGTLFVTGVEIAGDMHEQIVQICSVFITCVIVGLILYLSALIEKHFGEKRIIILGKMTGIYLATLASQMILKGVFDEFFTK